MYEQHFGLKKRPFPNHAAGNDVFVSPQAAATMAALKKALVTEDSVVTLTGEAGAGKTTIVKRTLEGIVGTRLVVNVGRVRLGHDEVLELLLAGVGARQLPKSTVHRFALFRRQLQQCTEKKTRVFIIVEDATRVGLNALSELEALTAADAGVSEGANLILMGDDGLDELLRDPNVARLKQRIRQRQKLQPLNASELLAYLKHCFRLAGNEFDSIFAAGSADAIHNFTGGVPRTVNGLVDAVLESAAENNANEVSVDLIERIAAEELGLTLKHSVAAIKDAMAKSELDAPKVPVEPVAPVIEAAPEPEPEPPVVQAPAKPAPPVIEAAPEPEPEPPVVQVPAKPAPPVIEAAPAKPEIPVVAPVIAAAAPAVVEHEEGAIPELIQDTLPDLEILAPELASEPTPEPIEPATPAIAAPAAADSPKAVEAIAPIVEKTVPADDELPTLSPSLRAGPPSKTAALTEDAVKTQPPESVAAEIPAWERDPTLAELKPDLEALERAMAVAHGADVVANAGKPAGSALKAKQSADTPAKLVPEITLDRQIEEKIEEATEALRQTQTGMDALNLPEPDLSAEASGETVPELAPLNLIEDTSKTPVAEEIQAATSEPLPQPAIDEPIVMEDEKASQQHAVPNPELQKIAAELAKAKTIEDVDDRMAETLFGAEISMIAAQVIANPPADISANDEIELELEQPDVAASAAVGNSEANNGVAVGIEVPPKSQDGNIDIGATQHRLATLRALNQGSAPAVAPTTPMPAESIVMQEDPLVAAQNAASEEPPETIEEQINTSITQTLKALNVRSPVFDDDDDEKPKGGFFSRFRKS